MKELITHHESNVKLVPKPSMATMAGETRVWFLSLDKFLFPITVASRWCNVASETSLVEKFTVYYSKVVRCRAQPSPTLSAKYSRCSVSLWQTGTWSVVCLSLLVFCLCVAEASERQQTDRQPSRWPIPFGSHLLPCFTGCLGLIRFPPRRMWLHWFRNSWL